MADRPWLYLDLTVALCARCLRRVEAKVIEEDGRIHLLKRCPEHGLQRVLVSTDPAYWRLCRAFLKPGQVPERFQTPVRWGCPLDCGLCADHEQHSCLTLVEITDRCNLRCPVCYAGSGPERTEERTLEEVEGMLDAVVRAEGRPDVVQLSGGEPTLHPRFFEILDAARRRPIQHLMVNTNGLRIAREPDFARRLRDYMPGFEVYLQFDSLMPGPQRALRGADLVETRLRALDALDAAEVSTTLVVTLKKGLNDGEIGDILRFAVTRPCVRGVTFQPVQHAGRADGYDPATDRLTLSEVRSEILRQWPVLAPADLLPVPCHPDNLAMAYALRNGGALVPLTGMIPREVLLQSEGSTIAFERLPSIRRALFDLFSTSHSPASSARSLAKLLCCLPTAAVPAGIGYRDLFRVLIVRFMDAEDLDMRSVKKSCITIATPDGRLVPFDTYNLFYRPGREGILERLRGSPTVGAAP